MPKTIPNYQQGKVYKMTIGDLIYIGSTCQKYLCQRLTAHTKAYNYWVKNKDTQKKVCYMTSYELYKIGKPTITLLESCPCNSKDELLACEGKYIQQFKCVNQRKEGLRQTNCVKPIEPIEPMKYVIPQFNKTDYINQFKEQQIDLYKSFYEQMKEPTPIVSSFNRKEYEKQYKEQHRDLYLASYRKSYEKRRRVERLTLFIHKHIEFVQNRI